VALPRDREARSTAQLDVATGSLQALTQARALENNPVFSPDGQWVAYWYPRDGRGDRENEVWIVPASGGTPRPLTRSLDRNLFGATWMPDGRSLLVAGNERATVGAWIQSIDGSARRSTLRPS
jgi:Tol biopolymer transport system component